MIKNILVDHSNIGRYCGFAEISKNYGRCLAEMDIPDIHFIYMVPRQYFGYFGDNVSYISSETPISDLRQLGVKIDLWHATDQLFKFRLHLKGIKQLMTVHDLITIQKKKGIHKLKHLLKFRWRVAHTDCVAVISNYVKDDLDRYGVVDRLPVVRIPNAVRDLENDPREKPSFVGTDDKFFLAVGHVQPRKNYESIAAMMSQFPEYKLYICGECDTKYAEELKTEVENAFGGGRVIMPGGVGEAEKNWLYAHCEAFFMPSLMEGFGLPILEAMRFGRPVFCANSSSLPEVGDKYAHYWSDFSPEAMAKVVRDGLASFSESTDGAAEVEYSRKFDYQNFTRRYVNLYRTLLRDRKPMRNLSLAAVLQNTFFPKLRLRTSVSEQL